MCQHAQLYEQISRVPGQNGVSQLYIMLEIHHSGREPSICPFGYTLNVAEALNNK